MSGRAFVPLHFPAWLEFRQRRGAKPNAEHWAKRGEHGHRLCGWCGTEVAPPRQKWCSQKCVAAFGHVWSWGAIRGYVFRRDGGTCRRCSTTAGPWEVDHIKRVIDGGTDHPDNLRLLCHDCHVNVGYEQRGRPLLALDDRRARATRPRRSQPHFTDLDW